MILAVSNLHRSNILFIAFTIIAGFFLISLLSDQLILTKEIYYDYFGNQVEDSRLSEVVNKTKSFNKVKAIWLPVSHGLSILGITIALNIGMVFTNQKVKFKNLFRIVITSYIIFLIPDLINFFYFLTHSDFSLAEYNKFSFGSLMFLLDTSDPYWLKALVETLSFFEIAFWILLAYGVLSITNLDFDQSLKMILLSYGTALIFWVVVKIYFMVVILDKG
jgi:hypothetical protein